MSNHKQLQLNKPQLRYTLYQPKEATGIWGRGVGKSSLIAWQMHQVVQKMPRSAWSLVGATYQQILTRTLPSTIASLARLGYQQGVHFFVRSQPPKLWGWDLPYEAPLRYNNFIIFYTGAGFHLVSQDKKTSSRGLNVDGVIADEALLLDKQKFNKDASATNRGNEVYFKKINFHHGIFRFSSMPVLSSGFWLLDHGQYYQEKGHNIATVRNRLVDLQLQFVRNKDLKHRLELWSDITELKKKLYYYPGPDGLFYSEADVFDNLENLGMNYIEQQYREMTQFEFETEMLNKRPMAVENGFYPLLDEKVHAYTNFNNSYLDGLDWNNIPLDCRQDADCMIDRPLRLAVDWGSNISSLSVAQRLPGEYRFIKDFYVKHPKLVADLAKLFVDYYRPHNRKEILLIEDVWGNMKTPDSKLTYNQKFTAILQEAGWSVQRVSLGSPPADQLRYLLWNEILGEKNKSLPIFRFNKHNCKNVLVSMANAEAKQSSKGIEKNKQSERNPNIAQEQATHFSDTADQHALSIGREYLQGRIEFGPLVAR